MTNGVAWSDLAAGVNRWSGPSITELTGDAYPEILMGAVVHDHNGVILNDNLGFKYYAVGQIPVVADVDMDGLPELVTGDGGTTDRANRDIQRTIGTVG